MLKFKRFGLLLLTGMERTDTFENLANQRGLGRIDKAVIGVRYRDSAANRWRSARRQLATVVGQIAGNRTVVAGRKPPIRPRSVARPTGSSDGWPLAGRLRGIGRGGSSRTRV